jgi:Sec-independent protein secretion pathway component TatC
LAAAILTPPDPFSMLLLYGPLFVAFGLAYFVGRRHGRRIRERHVE